MKIKHNILLTGGLGYIGSLTTKLIKRHTNHDVFVIDNLSNSTKDNIIKGVKYFFDDFSNTEIIKKIIMDYKIDTVIHLAAHIDVEESIKDPLKYYENNVSKTITFLRTIIDNGVNNFVFSSSAAVYGNVNNKANKINESSKKDPINPYGESKDMVEKILSWCSKSYGLNCVILRYFNAAGADPDLEIISRNKRNHLISKLISCALSKDQEFYIFGNDYDTTDGTCIRDFVHVYDVAFSNIKAVDFFDENITKEEKGMFKIFNLGSGTGYSIKEIINIVKEITGEDFKVKIKSRREGDAAVIIADNTKIKNELKIDLKESNLRKIIQDSYNAELKLNSLK